jgi:hypothetical protein
VRRTPPRLPFLTPSVKFVVEANYGELVHDKSRIIEESRRIQMPSQRGASVIITRANAAKQNHSKTASSYLEQLFSS